MAQLKWFKINKIQFSQNFPIKVSTMMKNMIVS